MPFADFQRRYLRNRLAAEYLGVSESFLNKRRVTGEPPAFLKIGKIVAYTPRRARPLFDDLPST